MSRFVVVPQWQGSGSSRAMQLVDGAAAIAGDLPRASCTPLEVPLEAGESLGSGVRRLSSLVRVREALERELADGSEPTIVVGGDCGVALGAVSAIASSDLALVWFDAHADLNTPESSPSGAFGGMVLRALLGDAPARLALPTGTITTDRVVLAGSRDLDPAEVDFLAGSAIRTLAPDAFAEPARFGEAVAATGATRVHIHVDLDVLDPAAMSGVSQPVPFGPSVAEVVAAIRAVREVLPCAGATLTGFSPVSPDAAVDDLGAILRIIGALA
ncbi:MAG: arginase [Microbacterium sp.]|uniref:arginase family protein n=1 Tax=unclassified Microbacterium TaxID=2609290 RepID=UPI000C608337|nr:MULTISPECIES: arginase family protein [unclassified Microbacterium]MAY49031.1 arginase [Microbacterium sp.]HBS75003.1 arginase [Microbacterium sp.]|tara:strand:- start:113660 stop:114475 length:816 start_codon:yes stop_codon:yes gene_type:complete